MSYDRGTNEYYGDEDEKEKVEPDIDAMIDRLKEREEMEK